MDINNMIAAWSSSSLNVAVDKALQLLYTETGSVIRIDALAIDIDVQEGDNWQNAVNEQLQNKLAGQLQQAISGRLPGVHIIPATTAFFENLVYFLQHGYLQWNAAGTGKNEFDEGLFQWVVNISSSQKEMLAAVLAGENVAIRMANLLDNDNFIVFIQQFFQPQEIDAVLKDAGILVDTFPGKNTILAGNRKIMQLLKEKIIAAIPVNDNGGWIEYAVQEWLYGVSESLPAFLNNVNTSAINTGIIKESIDKLMNKPNEKVSGTKKVKQLPLEEELIESVYINNAGAVIIAAFLPRLFENTSISKNGSITNTEAAVCLVHYCITGSSQPAEFDLLLPKILCGVLPGAIVNTPVELSEGQIKEADEMLASVIEHWAVLKNTSVSGLQQAFLQRNGKLTYNGGEWLLQVEQKAHDILLQQLPWNTSMIKLSWMKEVLKTEWIF